MAFRGDKKPYNRNDNRGSSSNRGTSGGYRFGSNNSDSSNVKEESTSKKMTPQSSSSRKMTPQDSGSVRTMTPQSKTPQQDKKEEVPQVSETNPSKDTPIAKPDPASEDPYAATSNNGSKSTPDTAAGASKDAANDVLVCGLPPGARHGEKKFNGRCRLFVGNLERGTEEAELRQLFNPFGETGEVFVNKDKGFGFIRLDYRLNAERAKLTLDKKLVKGRPLQVRYALHASAIELHGLNQFASNEFIEEAMSQFGQVERACIVCDDRGRSKGYAIVEFAWKKSAQKVLDRFKDELFVLGRLPKPIYAKPFIQSDDEEGVHESDLQRINGYENEREFHPRFISPSALEFDWAKKWRDVFIEEEQKKAQLDEELRDSRYRLEIEMENVMHEREAMKMREDLMRRQEELRLFEEQMSARRDTASREREHAMQDRGMYDQRSMQDQRGTRNISSQNSSQEHMRGLANELSDQFLSKREIESKQEELLRAAGFGDQLGMSRLPAGLDQQGLADAQMMGISSHGQGRDEQRFDKRPRRN